MRWLMVIRGRVQHGGVILEDGAHLSEGEEVTIVAPDEAPPGQSLVPHSVLDIPPIRLGRVLRTLTPDDDLLGEMLEDRP